MIIIMNSYMVFCIPLIFEVKSWYCPFPFFINIDDFNCEIIYTPGHKEDSISIYFKEQNIMFTGDFIFKSAIGRTDLPGGDYNEMLKSLTKLKKYDKNIKIYPGHGDITYLRNEID